MLSHSFSHSLFDAETFDYLRSSLVDKVNRWTERAGDVATSIPGLTLFRRIGPTEPAHCMVEPSVALVVQGTKQALLGEQVYAYDIRNFIITSLDLPVMMCISEASPDKPYLGLILKLDLRVLSEIMLQSGFAAPEGQVSGRGMFLGDTSIALLDAFHRLMGLLDEPEAANVLFPLIEREIYYRLITSDQCARLWHITSVDSQSYRIARAVDWLRANFAKPLRVEELAAQVRMSPSAFHQHFRSLTAMSPLQYQKWLRLNEARRLMLSEHQDVSTSAFTVGYESPSQFSREYSRLFGSPPKRDIEQIRRLTAVA